MTPPRPVYPGPEHDRIMNPVGLMVIVIAVGTLILLMTWAGAKILGGLNAGSALANPSGCHTEGPR